MATSQSVGSTIPPDHGRLLYDEAVRRLGAQDTDLTNIRTRAGTLTAVISIVTTFLASSTLARSDMAEHPLAWIPLGLFVGSLFAAIYVLVCTVKVESGFSAAEVKSYIEAESPTIGYLAAHLSVQLEGAVEHNRPVLKRLRRILWLSVGALTLEMLSWFILLGWK